jgi:hypothetical protein
MSAYTTTTQIRRRLVAPDGKIINHSVSDHMAAQGYADRFPGSRYVEEAVEVEVAPYERVLIDSGIPEAHWGLLRADMQRFLNMTPDSGRPSDAMRSAVRAFKAGHLTEESFEAARPEVIS